MGGKIRDFLLGRHGIGSSCQKVYELLGGGALWGGQGGRVRGKHTRNKAVRFGFASSGRLGGVTEKGGNRCNIW